LYWTGLTGLIGSIAFSVSPALRDMRLKPKNNHPAFSGRKKPKRPIVLLPNVHVASLFCFDSQMNFLEEGYRFLPFFPAYSGTGRKGKKILKILACHGVALAKTGRSCLNK